MKKIFTILLLSSKLVTFSQNGAPANPYYNGFDWTQTGNTLKNALATKITSTHTNLLTYSQAENALRLIDADPTDIQNVLLIYGFSSNICIYTNETNYGTFPNWNEHRKRNKNADQPPTPVTTPPTSPLTECVWNREHVYAVSLGTPSLDTGTPSAGTDAHHLRTADVDRNALRGNKKFGTGSGNSGVVGANWYPGDEWKGDVARMMMYMYLRYPTQCKPTGVGTGSVVTTDTDMIQLFLQWNAEDPVSQYEDLRNTYLGFASNPYGQGNRNPFIDNPYLATRIWGGQVAQNRWPAIYLGTDTFDYENSVSIYPNPTTNENVNISSTVEWKEIKIYNINGQLSQSVINPNFTNNNTLQVTNLAKGFYFVNFVNENKSITKKLIIN
jgi:endonuclease I